MNRFYIKTFGCKLNQADSAGVRGALVASGFEEVFAAEAADLVLVNTCTVTHKADQDARREIRKLHRKAPHSKIIITGCYAQRDAEHLLEIDGVAEVFGLERRAELISTLTGKTPLDPDFGDDADSFNFGERSRAFLKVQEGCDYKCSYCVTTIVRGASRSLAAAEVVKRLQALHRKGYEEVVLTGIHLGLWGHDLGFSGPGKGMLHLMQQIDKAADMPKIRLNSLEPHIVLDEMLAIMAGSERFCHHLHLSIQSGSERILQAMKRYPYAREMYETAEKARAKMPLCGIGSDVIVGFPGETEEDFLATYKLMTDAPFTFAHVFGFSPRPGTVAAEMPDQIAANLIAERSNRLRQAVDLKGEQFRKTMIGKTISAILLDQKDDSGRQIALADNFVHLSVAGIKEVAPKAIIRVEITAVDGPQTLAKMVS